MAASAYSDIIRLNKPIGTWLLLWPALCGLYSASAGKPSLVLIAIFVAGAFIMRSAGCIINDLTDQRFDSHVARTKTRPLPAGRISRMQSGLLLGLLIILAMALALQLPVEARLHCAIALLFTVIYPWMKRITYFPQILLGLSFSWSIPIAYAAVGSPLDTAHWLLVITSCCWVVGFDSIYAICDYADDRKVGVKSPVVKLANNVWYFIAILYMVMVLSLYCYAKLSQLSMAFYVFFYCLLLSLSYQLYLSKNVEPNYCMRAFLHNKYTGALFLLCIIYTQ